MEHGFVVSKSWILDSNPTLVGPGFLELYFGSKTQDSGCQKKKKKEKKKENIFLDSRIWDSFIWRDSFPRGLWCEFMTTE